ncbi:CBS-domain-containing protein [Choiromyces venosus 120613-1]|uniref:CBS-domain-containing protein n=1 Tax=Choiromyces venosus 120613-1 TaxID=1336337 RepID=A0A3N4JPP1_9PEZI|nr:CBS-domain-containing protein [Choiromyces venosus 120613-1]
MSTTGGTYRGNPRTAPPGRGATPNFPPTPSGSGIPVPGPSSGGPSHSEVGSSVSDSRKRQSKRDEAIRRKIENDLNKKKHTVSRARQTRKVAPGTVMALRPSQALQIKPNTTVAEAAQIMAAKREDCVLVTDDEDRISGIFTAKDLAFRVVGTGINARDVTIAQIMTKNPLCARTDTSATDALDLMVRKGFRHLPVMDENQDISGILDITKCFYEAMEKLERAYASSRKLYDALEGVQSELGSSQPQQIIHYVEALRQKMSGPDLQSVLDGNPPTVVSVRTTVKEAAAMMKENRTTAVLVQDNGSITGIFTSKDVVLRVIAAGLDPANCSVVRVMTPHPDFAPMDMSIQAALRKMHDGHYLNLPVMNDAAEIVGMVDVLKLTYATLEQINSMGTTDSEGPAWNKFWMSLDNDTESAVSDGTRHTGPPIRPHQPDSPVRGSRHASGVSADRHDNSAILPTDSASHHGDSPPASVVMYQQHSNPLDVPFPFKFKAPSGRMHRCQVAASGGLIELLAAVVQKLGGEVQNVGGEPEFGADGKLEKQGFAMSYVDNEGDIVSITSDRDLIDAIEMARNGGRDKVDLYVHDPDSPAVIATVDPKPVIGTPTESIVHSRRRRRHEEEDTEESSEEEEDAVAHRKSKKSAASHIPVVASIQPEVVPGVPNELLLPGALVTLAVVIVGVFAMSRK